MSFERRRYPRKKMKAPAGLLIRGTYTLAETLEISEGGLSLSFVRDSLPQKLQNILEEIEIGLSLVATIKIPRRSLVVTEAILLDKKKGSEGAAIWSCRFKELTSSQRKLIREFVTAS